MTPLLVFISLSLCKLLFFRVSHLLLWLAICLSAISMTLVLYLLCDSTSHSLPVYVIAIPIALLLMSLTVAQIWEIVENNPVKAVLFGLDLKTRIIIRVISCCITVCYVISGIASLILMEQRSAHESGKAYCLNECGVDITDLIEFILLSTLIYVMVQMETAGSVFLDIIFEQFYFELIGDNALAKLNRIAYNETSGERKAKQKIQLKKPLLDNDV